MNSENTQNEYFNISNIQSGNDIRNEISKIKKTMSELENDDTYKETLKNKYPSFVDKYPTLFDKIISKTIDDEKLDFMLSMLTQIKTGEKTEFDASAAVGKKLFSEHVEPRLKK